MTAPSHPRDSTGRSLRVLLAEDNVTNQKLVVALLEKHGHRVRVVENGLLAIEAAKAESFDLILMDMLMPELDGLEASLQIRTLEARAGKRTPIVALTANALGGDRQRCLSAGMDGYLSKPIRPEEFFSVIDQISRGQFAAIPAVGSELRLGPPVGTNDVFDYALSVHQSADDPALLEQIIDAYLGQLPPLLTRLSEAVGRRDAEAIRQAAHALCSSTSALTAPRARLAARRLEIIGRNADLETALGAHAELCSEINLLRMTLQSRPWEKAA